jgi:hypothetical protein
MMKAGGNLGMNADDDGWADDMVERWFEEFETEQGDEPSREDQGRGAPRAWRTSEARAVD